MVTGILLSFYIAPYGYFLMVFYFTSLFIGTIRVLISYQKVTEDVEPFPTLCTAGLHNTTPAIRNLV